MLHPFRLYSKHRSYSFDKLYRPTENILVKTPVLKSKGDRPLKMSFEDQPKALIFYHLKEHSFGRHLLQVLKKDDFARNRTPPKTASRRATFGDHRKLPNHKKLFKIFNQRLFLGRPCFPEKLCRFQNARLIPNPNHISLVNIAMTMHDAWSNGLQPFIERLQMSKAFQKLFEI